MKLIPEPWTVEDCASSLPYVAFTQTFGPWATKLLAVSRAGRLSEEEWNDMLPVHPGADLPHEAWFDRSAQLKFGAIHPGAFALHAAFPGPRGRPVPRTARPARPPSRDPTTGPLRRARTGAPSWRTTRTWE